MRTAPVVLGLAIALAPLRAADFGASAAYSHLHPKHVGIECRECHSLEADQADIHKMPGHAACSACHNFAAEVVKRAEAYCGECHTSLNATKDRPALYDFPRQHGTHDFGDLFSHVGHKKAGAATRCDASGGATQSQCADCHAPSKSAGKRPDKQMEASHTFCFACHCENPRGYSAAQKSANPSRNDCAVCHAAHEGAPTSFADIKEFRHADHVLDTRPRLKSAGPVSHDPDVLCVECHKTAAESKQLSDIREPAAARCSSCHTGKVGLPDVLNADVLRTLEQRP
jgi:hypothetical protein